MLRKLLKISGISLAGIVLFTIVLSAIFFISRPEESIDKDTNVGMFKTSYSDTNRNRVLETNIWYLTDDNTEASLQSSNALFFGYSVKAGATPANLKSPLIILSHGSGGNNANQGWLAVELAKRGAVVVAANHPGSTSRDSAPSTNIQMWNRPQDISFLLDELLEDSFVYPLIDPNRIAAVGHSLGGYTVMASGGGVLSKSAFIEYCETFPANPDCVFYRTGGVDLNSVSQPDFEQSHKDDRIGALIVFDPAYARSFDVSSLTTLPPTLLVTPRVEKDTIDDLQVDYLRGQLAKNNHNGIQNMIIDGAHHFSFLARCKPYADYILGIVEKGAEVLCAREIGIDRVSIHTTVINEVVEFLEKNEIID